MPPPDPRVSFRLVHGTGALTAANVNGSTPDILISWDNAHWLHEVTGADEAPWRSLEAAVAAAFFIGGDDVPQLQFHNVAMSLQLLDNGLPTDRAASVNVALRVFVNFCRDKRASHVTRYTIDDDTLFFTLPGWHWGCRHTTTSVSLL